MTTSSVSVVPVIVSPKRAMTSPDTFDDDEAASEQSSPKRVKREMPDYSALNLSQLKLEDNGFDKKGDRLLRPLLGESLLQCNITPLGFQVSPWGFDVSGKFQKPSFLTNQPTRGSEGLNLPLTFKAAGEANFLRQVDTFFKDKLAELDPKLEWCKLELEPRETHHTELFRSKVKVVLSGEGLTEIKVIDPKMEVHIGTGWPFLHSHLDAFHNFREARVKVAICVSNLWGMGGKAGLTLTATHLVLTFPKPSRQVNGEETFRKVFDDDTVLREIGDD